MKRRLEGILARAALVGIAALPLTASAAWFDAVADSEQLTAINSKEYNGYQRSRAADGSFRPETFAFGDGQEIQATVISGQYTSDPTMNVSFKELAHMLSGPLARENYVVSTDPASTKLLVMVFWGRTIGGFSFGNVMDSLSEDLNAYQNATLLGFEDVAATILGSESDSFQGQILRNLHASIASDVEVNRYYVIIRAFDFQDAWKHHKMKLLWETRFSLPERRHDFERDVPMMALSASPYFGQDSYGLTKRPEVPEGKVEIGDVRLVDYVKLDDGQAADSASSLAGVWRAKNNPRIVLTVGADGQATWMSRNGRRELPARLRLNEGTVRMTVPGWDVNFEGSLSGNTISGQISEYGSRGKLKLEKQH